MAEIGDGLEVGHQFAGQPHQLDIAPSLPLQLPARGQLMQISIDVELEHGARRVTGSAGGCRLHALEAELGQIEFIDKGIDDANWVRLDLSWFRRTCCILISALLITDFVWSPM